MENPQEKQECRLRALSNTFNRIERAILLFERNGILEHLNDSKTMLSTSAVLMICNPHKSLKDYVQKQFDDYEKQCQM